MFPGKAKVPDRSQGLLPRRLVRSEKAGEHGSDDQHRWKHSNNDHYLNDVPIDFFHLGRLVAEFVLGELFVILGALDASDCEDD
jgi:hypothetical protein